VLSLSVIIRGGANKWTLAGSKPTSRCRRQSATTLGSNLFFIKKIYKKFIGLFIKNLVHSITVTSNI
jgi:hypothetical protein